MASIARGWKWAFFCLKLWRVSVFTNGIVKYSFLFDCLSKEIFIASLSKR
jgi:hypothetical protein